MITKNSTNWYGVFLLSVATFALSFCAVLFFRPLYDGASCFDQTGYPYGDCEYVLFPDALDVNDVYDLSEFLGNE